MVMVKLFLFLLKFLRKPVVLLGADYNQLRAIVGAKLMSDFRRVPEASKGMQKERSLAFQIITYLLVGFLVALLLLTMNNHLMGLMINYTFILFLLCATLITEFTQVVFDPSDNIILLPRPISNRTLMVSRLLHITFYISVISLSLSLPATIMILVNWGFVPMLAYLCGVFTTSVFALFSANFIYLVLSQVMSAERFKNLITYLQVGLSVLLFVGYFFIGKIPQDLKLVENISSQWWSYLVQPLWSSMLVDLAAGTSITLGNVALAALSIIVPLFGLTLMVRYLTKGYDAILEKLATSTERHEEVGNKYKGKNLLRRLVCRTTTEEAGWKLAMIISSRDRNFKQMVYPFIGFAFAYIFVILKPDFSHFKASIWAISQSKSYYGFIFMGIYIGMAFGMIRASSSYQAAWIYKVTPLEHKGELLSGAIKAMLFKIFIPAYTLICLPALFIWGAQIIPILIFGGILVVLTHLVTILLFSYNLPFSIPPSDNGRGANVAKMLIMMLFAGVAFGIIYLLNLAGTAAFWGGCLLAGVALYAVFLEIKQKKIAD
jgi:hypothetical protein